MAGVFYLLTFLTGIFAFLDRSKVGMAAGVIAGAFYMAVTLLFEYLSLILSVQGLWRLRRNQPR